MDNTDSRISLVCRHQAAARKHTFRSDSAPSSSKAAYFHLSLYSSIAGCVSGLPNATSKSSLVEKENFLAQVEWLPVIPCSQRLSYRLTNVRLVQCCIISIHQFNILHCNFMAPVVHFTLLVPLFFCMNPNIHTHAYNIPA